VVPVRIQGSIRIKRDQLQRVCTGMHLWVGAGGGKSSPV
jgi:hypothetical protein